MPEQHNTKEPIDQLVQTHPSNYYNYQQPPISNSTEHLRSKVVEIVSQTANGCLKELGYHPDVVKRLAQAESTIERLKLDNAKLYIDNRTLTSHLALQNDRIAFYQSSADDQWRKTVTLHEENHHLTKQYKNLKSLYEAAATGLPIEEVYKKLLTDTEQVHKLYRQAVAEVTTLRFEVQRLTDQCIKHGLFVLQPRTPQGSVSVLVAPPHDSLERRRVSDIPVPQQQMGVPRSIQPTQSHPISQPLKLNINQPFSGSFIAQSAFPPVPKTNHDQFRLRPLLPSTSISTRSVRSLDVVDLTNDDDEGSRKRMKLGLSTSEDQHRHQEPSTPAPGPSDQNRNPDEIMMQTPITPVSKVEYMQRGVTFSEEDQRAIFESCVDAIIEERDSEGKRVCKLCMMRHSLNLIAEVPKPWVGASLDELVKHCQNEHPAAWQKLLAGGDEDEDEEEEDEDKELQADVGKSG